MIKVFKSICHECTQQDQALCPFYDDNMQGQLNKDQMEVCSGYTK